MKTIWKYNLDTTDEQEIEAPDNAVPLCVQTQHGEPCLWMLVDLNVPARKYGVRIFGTGHPVYVEDDYWKYVGTYQYRGNLVFHVFVA